LTKHCLQGKTLVTKYLSKEWIKLLLIHVCRLNFKEDNFQYHNVLHWQSTKVKVSFFLELDFIFHSIRTWTTICCHF